MRLGMALAPAALLAVCSIAGCPSGPCAPAQKGALNGRCVELSCPKASHIDDARRACVCADGSTEVAGACVPYRVADAFCGRAATSQPGGGCVRKKCGAGEALDLDHGLCLPEAAGRASLSRGASGREQDEDNRRASCLFGALVSHGLANQLSCAIGPLACGRGEHFVKTIVDAGSAMSGTCEATPACGAGELFDEAGSSCTRVVHTSQGTFVVDVGAWARLVVGTDGGEGTAAFCAPVRATGAAGHFQLELSFQNNDVTQASGKLTPLPGTLPNAADGAERSLEQLIEVLRFYGGSASAAAVSLDVSCSPPMPASPTLETPKLDLDSGR